LRVVAVDVQKVDGQGHTHRQTLQHLRAAAQVGNELSLNGVVDVLFGDRIAGDGLVSQRIVRVAERSVGEEAIFGGPDRAPDHEAVVRRARDLGAIELEVRGLRARLARAQQDGAGAQGNGQQGTRPAGNGRLTTSALSFFPLRQHGAESSLPDSALEAVISAADPAQGSAGAAIFVWNVGE
jgi:hypothetical protein